MSRDSARTSDRAHRDQALFNTIAQHYCRKDLFESSRIARRHRLLRTVKPCMPFSAAQPDILEVGCGAGYSTEHLRDCYGSYTGIDYSEELIGYARSTFNDTNISFHADDFYDYDSTARYDIIIMIGVLHHMTDLQAALRKCMSLLKPGGYVVANEPQPNNPLIHLLRGIRTRVDSSYSAEQEELSSDLLTGEYEKAGFVDVASIPQGLLSTPMAEVILKPQLIFRPLSKVACGIDAFLENKCPRLVRNLAWNTIVYGRNPGT